MTKIQESFFIFLNNATPKRIDRLQQFVAHGNSIVRSQVTVISDLGFRHWEESSESDLEG